MITRTRYDALRIVRDLVKARPRAFAERMWPYSPGWNRSQNVGRNGAARGVGMCKAGGSYLGKLAAAGLVRWHSDLLHTRQTRRGPRSDYDNYYAITDAGITAIKEYWQAHREELKL